MKNQPNKATVKDGLPTAEQIIRTKIKEHSDSAVKIDVDNIPAFTHFLFVAIDTMQSYSDQQNAELREQLKETENSLDGTTYNLKRVVKKCNGLTERVKELEAGLAYAIRAMKAVNSFGATKPIIEDLEKTLKK